MSKNKKKKTKVRYIDDGRSLADMSGVTGFGKGQSGANGTFKEQWTTYWNAVKLMFIPMLVTIGIITLVFLIMWILLTIGYMANP